VSDQAAPLLLDADAAAALCGVSRTSWYTMVAGGSAPAASLRAGRIVRWSAVELREWIKAGCPKQEDWIGMRPKKLARA
jgi:predicted DNA-binding transcriptional regulator AlpA